jgi:hypothetical protein
MSEVTGLPTEEQGGETPVRRERGRPRKHEDRKAASRAASAAYRARRKARRESPTIESKIIDLSAIPAYKVKR